MQPAEITNLLLRRAEQALAAGREPLVVLDLDGTLYNNIPRTLRIIQEFAHQHALRYPGFVSAVDRLASASVRYSVAETVRELGVSNGELLEALLAFWRQRFFTDEYVVHDLPTPGAPQFVRQLHASCVVPTYLTGRDAPNMLVGTIRALQRDGFPVGTVDTKVILKENFETPDEPYKQSVVDHLQRSGEVVAVFDNEPGICNMFKRAFPEAIVVWLDTSHAPGAPPLDPGVETVEDFAGLVS